MYTYMYMYIYIYIYILHRHQLCGIVDNHLYIIRDDQHNTELIHGKLHVLKLLNMISGVGSLCVAPIVETRSSQCSWTIACCASSSAGGPRTKARVV